MEIELPFARRRRAFPTLDSRELEALARPIVERTRRALPARLADAKLGAGRLDEVILVGGQTRMPLVRSGAGDLWARAEHIAKPG